METKFKIGNKVSFPRELLISGIRELVKGPQCKGVIKKIENQDTEVLLLKLELDKGIKKDYYIYSYQVELCYNKYFNIKVFNRLFKNGN